MDSVTDDSKNYQLGNILILYYKIYHQKLPRT